MCRFRFSIPSMLMGRLVRQPMAVRSRDSRRRRLKKGSLEKCGRPGLVACSTSATFSHRCPTVLRAELIPPPTHAQVGATELYAVASPAPFSQMRSHISQCDTDAFPGRSAVQRVSMRLNAHRCAWKPRTAPRYGPIVSKMLSSAAAPVGREHSAFDRTHRSASCAVPCIKNWYL